MSIRIKKYNKLLQEVKYLRSELEYQEAVLSGAHLHFEETYRQWCIDNDFDLNAVEQTNSERVDEIFTKQEGVLAQIEKKPKKRDEKRMNKLYKQLAKELHPDKNNGNDTEFKNVNEAYQKGNWSILLEEALKRGIEPDNATELIPLLREEAQKLKKKIERNEAMYSWKFHECEDDKKCQENVIKHFLKHLFKLEI